jgi:hypothetical protein
MHNIDVIVKQFFAGYKNNMIPKHHLNSNESSMACYVRMYEVLGI